MKILFTRNAEKKYYLIREYIGKEWGENVAQEFEYKTANFLDLLEKFPELGSIEEPEKKIRGFQLTNQTRIFYRIKRNKIIILTFFDVRQDPSKKYI